MILHAIETESEKVNQACMIAQQTDCPLYISNISLMSTAEKLIKVLRNNFTSYELNVTAENIKSSSQKGRNKFKKFLLKSKVKDHHLITTSNCCEFNKKKIMC